ncbi:hypothetical protein SAMN05421806_117116 [Streptomyces indicus]|uniref:Uncharacterized protein n=1 Tax=Streptomyces indicus TaxID=417292 RepID=A0A1G9GZZ1_9ACTN|nr:hypothetical protein SAMN05421806_117116 [Streptomyces indicus]
MDSQWPFLSRAVDSGKRDGTGSGEGVRRATRRRYFVTLPNR